MHPTAPHDTSAPPSAGHGPRFKLAALALVLVSGLCCLGLAHFLKAPPPTTGPKPGGASRNREKLDGA